jgi:hypothetical protein
MTDNGINAVAAIIHGVEGYIFEGKFSNADVAAIKKAFNTVNPNFKVPAHWLAGLRQGERGHGRGKDNYEIW